MEFVGHPSAGPIALAALGKMSSQRRTHTVEHRQDEIYGAAHTPGLSQLLSPVLGTFMESTVSEEALKLHRHLLGGKCGWTIQREAYTAINGTHGKVETVEPEGHHEKRFPEINSLMETITTAMSKKHAHVRMGKNAEL